MGKMGKRAFQTTADVEARYGVAAGGGYQPVVSRSTPLTTNQHILHLLLTVFTFGLWLPVWIWLAIRGNRNPA